MEDVRLMAGFMGWTHLRVTTGEIQLCFGRPPEGGVSMHDVPDYPNNMTELSEVMDKLEETELVYFGFESHLHPAGRNRSVGVTMFKGLPTPMRRIFYNFTSLPSVLFPLLVEVIKQVKESDNENNSN